VNKPIEGSWIAKCKTGRNNNGEEEEGKTNKHSEKRTVAELIKCATHMLPCFVITDLRAI
jgi:hypothetical protein